jgi:hypothetical protein
MKKVAANAPKPDRGEGELFDFLALQIIMHFDPVFWQLRAL